MTEEPVHDGRQRHLVGLSVLPEPFIDGLCVEPDLGWVKDAHPDLGSVAFLKYRLAVGSRGLQTDVKRLSGFDPLEKPSKRGPNLGGRVGNFTGEQRSGIERLPGHFSTSVGKHRYSITNPRDKS